MAAAPSLDSILELANVAERSGSSKDYQALVDAEVAYLRAKERALETNTTRQQGLTPSELHLLAGREESHSYVRQWSQLDTSLRRHESWLKYVEGVQSPLARADILHASHTDKWMESWEDVLAASTVTLTQLEESSRDHRDVPLPNPQILSHTLNATLVPLHDALARDPAYRQAQSRGGSNAQEVFLSSNGELIKWCRTKIQQLENLHSFEEIRDGPLRAFADSSTKMETNLLRLQQNLRQLGGGRANFRALEGVHRTWNTYAWTLCDRLHQSTLDFADQSLHYDAWKHTEGPRILAWLERVAHVLESLKASPRGETLHRRAKSLQREVQTFNLLAAHMSEFGRRNASIRVHYDTLRNELLSDTTAVALSSIGELEVEAEESAVDEAISQLQGWIRVHESTRALEEIRRLAEKMRMTADPLAPVV